MKIFRPNRLLISTTGRSREAVANAALVVVLLGVFSPNASAAQCAGSSFTVIRPDFESGCPSDTVMEQRCCDDGAVLQSDCSIDRYETPFYDDLCPAGSPAMPCPGYPWMVGSTVCCEDGESQKSCSFNFDYSGSHWSSCVSPAGCYGEYHRSSPELDNLCPEGETAYLVNGCGSALSSEHLECSGSTHWDNPELDCRITCPCLWECQLGETRPCSGSATTCSQSIQRCRLQDGGGAAFSGSCEEINPCVCKPGAEGSCFVEGCKVPGKMSCNDTGTAWSACDPSPLCTNDGGCDSETDGGCCVAEPEAGQPVVLRTGEVRYTPREPDASLNTNKGTFELRRSFSSAKAPADMIGDVGASNDASSRWGGGWFDLLDQYLTYSPFLTHVAPDGQGQIFTALTGRHGSLRVVSSSSETVLVDYDKTELAFATSGTRRSLLEIREPHGHHLVIVRYGLAESTPCGVTAEDPKMGMPCLLDVDDGAAGIYFGSYEKFACEEGSCDSCATEYCGETAIRLTELSYGQGIDPALYDRATRYIYRVGLAANDSGTTCQKYRGSGDCTEEPVAQLSRVEHLTLEGATWSVVDGESYEYTVSSYWRPDLDASETNYTSSESIVSGVRENVSVLAGC